MSRAENHLLARQLCCPFATASECPCLLVATQHKRVYDDSGEPDSEIRFRASPLCVGRFLETSVRRAQLTAIPTVCFARPFSHSMDSSRQSLPSLVERNTDPSVDKKNKPGDAPTDAIAAARWFWELGSPPSIFCQGACPSRRYTYESE